MLYEKQQQDLIYPIFHVTIATMMMEPLSVISLTSAIRSLDNALKTHLMTLDGLTEDTKAADVSADSETKNPVAEKLSNGSSRAETEIVVQPKRNSIVSPIVAVIYF